MNFKKYHVSKNLWNETLYDKTVATNTIVYVPIYVGDVSKVTCSTTSPKGEGEDDKLRSRIIFFLAGNVSTGAQNGANGVSINEPRTITPTNGYVTIAYRWLEKDPPDDWKPWNNETMVNVGDTAQPYEPYSSEVWHDVPLYIYTTATDTITTLPADLYADGQPIGANLSPVGTFSITAHSASQRIDIFSGTLKAGDYVVALNQDNSITGSTRNTLQVTIGGVTYYNSSNTDYHNQSGQQSMAFTVTETGNVDVKYWANDLNEDCSYSNIMFNEGSTPLPYQPYAPTIIKGNMSQTGTPTPQNPITPSECGERTENLVEDYIADCNIWTDGTLTSDTSFKIFVAKVVQGQEYSLDAPLVCGFFTSKPSIGSTSYNNARDTSGVYSFVAPIDGYIAFRKASTETTAMLNTGSTIKPYEPYGYVLPIKSGNTTTPVYLGQVQTTRKIKKLVLTGTENWTKNDAGNPSNYLYYQTGYLANKTCVCSHLADMGTLSASKVGVFNGNNVLYLNFGSAIMNAQPSGNTVEGLKEYLAQQYAAGTPVTVWYVLANETTGIVNEPLRKIGDYADSVSGISIPTIAGANTLSVGTTIQPSEVTVNYKGWHPVQSVHEMHTHLDASLFELGTITGYGQKDELTTRIRTKTFIDLSNTKSINTLSSAKVFLIAWTEEATTIGYYYCVGGWNGSSFGNQTGLWLSEIDVESIVETYPTYKFAVILRYDDNREVTDFDDLLSLVDFYPKTW